MIAAADVEAMIAFFDALGYDPPESAVSDPAKYVAACVVVLYDLSGEQLNAACLEYARRGARTWPKPRDLLEMLRVDVEAHADAVWGELRQVPWAWSPQRQPRTMRTWSLGASPDVDLAMHRALDAAAVAFQLFDAVEGLEPTHGMRGWWAAVRSAPIAAWRAAHCLPFEVYERVSVATREHGDDDPPAPRGAWWLDADADEHARRLEAVDAIGGWRAFVGAGSGTATSAAMQATFRRVYAAAARRREFLLTSTASAGMGRAIGGSTRAAELTTRAACDTPGAGMARTRRGQRGG